MKEPRCTCRHPKSWHAKTDALYQSNPERFAPMAAGHPDLPDPGMCALRTCTCLCYQEQAA